MITHVSLIRRVGASHGLIEGLAFTSDQQHAAAMRHFMLAFLVACNSTNTGSSKPDASSNDPSTDTAGSPSDANGGASQNGGSPSKPDASSNDPSPNDLSAGGSVGD